MRTTGFILPVILHSERKNILPYVFEHLTLKKQECILTSYLQRPVCTKNVCLQTSKDICSFIYGHFCQLSMLQQTLKYNIC